MRLLTRTDILRALSMPEAIEAVKQAFIELSAGNAQIPPRSAIAVAAHEGVTLFMPGYLPSIKALAVKIVSVHDRNPAQGLKRINALVALFAPETGLPIAVMDGSHLTALRTGAGSGVATDLLARKDACVSAVFGAGVQARTQLQAIAAVRRLTRCWIYARDPGKVRAMIEDVRPTIDPSIELLHAQSPSLALKEADIVCTATNSRTPVFPASELRAGTHINAIGVYQPENRELDTDTIKRATKIVVDSREGALSEAGDLLIPLSAGDIQMTKIYAEIGEIAAGIKAGRETPDEVTLFKSVGNAAQDAAVALAIYRRALQENLGIEVEL